METTRWAGPLNLTRRPSPSVKLMPAGVEVVDRTVAVAGRDVTAEAGAAGAHAVRKTASKVKPKILRIIIFSYSIESKSPVIDWGGWGGNPNMPSSTSFPRECGEPARSGRPDSLAVSL